VPYLNVFETEVRDAISNVHTFTFTLLSLECYIGWPGGFIVDLRNVQISHTVLGTNRGEL